jgi:ABC-type uncharacterized transport system ATPase subunit
MLIIKSYFAYVFPETLLPEMFKEFLRRRRESGYESAVYERLKMGPEIPGNHKHPAERQNVVKEITQLITPRENSGHYSLIVGEHGTGKTSLIKLAVGNLTKPKGVVYVCVSSRFVDDLRKALGWNPDSRDVDPKQRNF